MINEIFQNILNKLNMDMLKELLVEKGEQSQKKMERALISLQEQRVTVLKYSVTARFHLKKKIE